MDASEMTPGVEYWIGQGHGQTGDVGTSYRLRSARAKRHRKATECFTTAAAAIGPIEPGISIFGVTRGQFSMIDIILHLLAQIEQAEISVWTWAIADYEVECFEKLLTDQRITNSLLVIDRSAVQRNAKLIQRWRNRFGPESVRVCKNHAKIARVTGKHLQILARGSMNLNENPRFEQFDISEGGPEYDLIERLENELPVLRPKASNREADEAS